MTQSAGDTEIASGTIPPTQTDGKTAAPIGEAEPDAVLDAGTLFHPRAILTSVSMWIVGPTVATVSADAFLIRFPVFD